MRRWKEAVSSVHRARKKRYWRRIGWVARKLGVWMSVIGVVSVVLELEAVPFMRLLRLDE